MVLEKDLRATIGRAPKRPSWTGVQLLLLCGMAAVPAAATETTTFTYDALGRLTQSSNAGGPRSGGPGAKPPGGRGGAPKGKR